MRDRVTITAHTPAIFSLNTTDDGSGVIKDGRGRPVNLTFSKQAVAGRHWFRARFPRVSDATGPFVSQKLLDRLLPLMPDRVHIAPVSVAGNASIWIRKCF
ncbi:MAG: hypothetical protein ACKVP7_10540 [Hyphomicrobiaceae bacterium]